MKSENNYNQLKNNHKPNIINVLYITESPPAGGTFYAANSNLFRCIMNAFKMVFGERVGNKLAFLDYFTSNGFFLEDLCFGTH